MNEEEIFEPRACFRSIVRKPDHQLNLAAAALCIAWEDQGISNVSATLRKLDALAAVLQPHLREVSDPQQAVTMLNQYLFEHLRFRGNTENYHEPANSFLDQVLVRRTGLPIALSVLYLEVGWRLGLPLAGVALPGHFLARYRTLTDELFIDPFHGGRHWSRQECEDQIQRAYGKAPAHVVQLVMEPPSRQAILVRMLRNLKHTYLARGDMQRALAAVERITLLLPDAAAELRDRGLLRSQLGQRHRALEDLERYATLAPAAPDLAEVQKLAQALAERLATGN
jgi:regulator of sirC expression with transglutaminase-like and TPR domain